MTAEVLLAMSDAELEALAVERLVGPAIGRGHGGELVDRVAAGLKPATLIISAGAAAYALTLELVARAVPLAA